ncbi:MAG: FAD binding domain-containing protein [Thermodesulfobacteriota bacterium]
MKSFKHIDVKTVKEACLLLGKYKEKARMIAGGTDLLGILKDKILPSYPEVIINIKAIPKLDGMKEDQHGLRIGALTTLSEIANSSVIKEKYKVLAQSADAVGSPQIRNVATLAGNLCQDVRCWYYRYPHHIGGRMICLRKGSGRCLALSGDNRYHAILEGKRCFAVCPSDTAVALTALDAKISIAGMRKNRIVPVRNFFTTLGNVLKPGEMITEIQVPRPSGKTKQTFLKSTLRKPIDFAIVSVASVLYLEDGICAEANIAIGAVAPVPIQAERAEQIIKGRAITPETAAKAAEAAVAGARPLSMNAYKVEMTKTLVKRAILSP